MELNNAQIRTLMIHYFKQGKTAAYAAQEICKVHGEGIVAERTCQKWFARFRDGNFNVNDEPREGRPKKLINEELTALLDENPAQTQEQLAAQLDVDQATVSRHLKELGKILKAGKWVPHVLSQQNKNQRLNLCTVLLEEHKKKPFLHNIVTGDESWVYYENPKPKKEYLSPGQRASSTPKKNQYGRKKMLCVWWDQKGIIFIMNGFPMEKLLIRSVILSNYND